jgi:hypothetical protein
LNAQFFYVWRGGGGGGGGEGRVGETERDGAKESLSISTASHHILPCLVFMFSDG